jgi:hypothetical protein
MTFHNDPLGIYQGEIWTQSQCLQQEHSTHEKITSHLSALGYTQTESNRIWKKGTQTSVVCLVDDIFSCGQDFSQDLPYLFDRNTRVITDNYLTCPSQYQVINLPDSFFGIYSYVPAEQIWNPTKDFVFSVNRIDDKRLKLMLELTRSATIDQGYVNFNCQIASRRETDPAILKNQFQQQWAQIDTQEMINRYKPQYNHLESLMPFLNHNLDFETLQLSGILNIIIETYSSDNNIALSEKIFRALVTPAPWTVFSGRYTVAYLEKLGFDTMRDIIDHSHYDRLKETENKINIFIWKSLDIIKNLKSQNFETLQHRCQQAASHNQTLLTQMSQQWPDKFERWLTNL